LRMASLHVSIPRALREYVEAVVAEGAYSTPSEFIRELIRAHQRTKEGDAEEVAVPVQSDSASTRSLGWADPDRK
jgi:antitoxin ParD1/3/4